MCVCVCERERETIVSVCVCERERENDVCVCEKEWECVYGCHRDVCVHVCVRENRERESLRKWDMSVLAVIECVCVCVCV